MISLINQNSDFINPLNYLQTNTSDKENNNAAPESFEKKSFTLSISNINPLYKEDELAKSALEGVLKFMEKAEKVQEEANKDKESLSNKDVLDEIEENLKEKGQKINTEASPLMQASEVQASAQVNSTNAQSPEILQTPVTTIENALSSAKAEGILSNLHGISLSSVEIQIDAYI